MCHLDILIPKIYIIFGIILIFNLLGLGALNLITNSPSLSEIYWLNIFTA